ncbi:MAG: hypothetical protein RSB71_02045 [Bacilli bacterium]
MKINAKGFILAETIAVSAVVLATLIIIYTQFISINNSYRDSFKYNTVDKLYAVDNVISFIEKDGVNNIIKDFKTNPNNYIDITSCSTSYFIEFNYCESLFKTLDIKQVIFTTEDITKLKEDISKTNPFSEEIRSFMKKMSFKKDTNKYRLIVEFNDKTLATLKGDTLLDFKKNV